MEELPLVEDKALPRTPMYCRECNKTTGKFVAKVKNRNKEQYVIQCSSCGQRWLINVSDYRRQNAGFVNMNGDYIPPSRNGQIPKHLQLQKDKRMKEFREQLGLPQPNNEPEFIWGGPKRGLIPNPKFQNNLK
jgi:transcription elongation factor Elf1